MFIRLPYQMCALSPFRLEAAAVWATFVHPNHIVYLCSCGFTHLSPTCNSKSFGYISRGTIIPS
ncbi:hypothetical protein B8B90_09090 [Vibrio cholerae]|nr:hypothetical protein B7977_00675 [Vibrio cholerae]ORP64392.1 hypothetical protein B7959_17125 [Vibrio cholerae]ORQ20723.1 hypothetical protein B8B90_09090 [Vibrio cholerae]ORQ38747.1 hypothetical protein B8T87_01055 [Vibrio cholerae]ORQ48222.1 hypothetical protein B8T92_05350 [Vibrio cholerae]